MPAELALRSRIVAALRERGCYVLVTTGVASAGTPDLLVCYRGHFIALEVKAPSGGRVARIQEVVLQMIERAGGSGAIVRSVDEALALLDTGQPRDRVVPEGRVNPLVDIRDVRNR